MFTNCRKLNILEYLCSLNAQCWISKKVHPSVEQLYEITRHLEVDVSVVVEKVK